MAEATDPIRRCPTCRRLPCGFCYEIHCDCPAPGPETVSAPRPADCPCFWWQPGGTGPWAVLCGPSWCPHHGDDKDDEDPRDV